MSRTDEIILNDEELTRSYQDEFYYSMPEISTLAGCDGKINKEASLVNSIWSSIFSSKLQINNDSTDTPERYSDCVTENQKIMWLQSPRGQDLLSRRPLLNEFYKNGKIFKMIRNKHWDVRLNDWLSEHEGKEAGQPFGMNLPLNKIVREQMKNRWIHTPHVNPSLNVMFTNHCYCDPVHFPMEHKYEILIDGFTVFRNIVPPHVLDAAQAAISNMIVNSEHFGLSFSDRKKRGVVGPNEDPFFTSGVTNDRSVLALFYQSPVYALVEALLHNNSNNSICKDSVGNGSHSSKRWADNRMLTQHQRHFHNYTQGAQVAYRFSEARTMHSSGSDKLGGLGWHIDGMERGQYGSFSLLIGFPLSDQSADYSGNLCLHAGSHHILNSTYVKEYALACEAVNGGKEPAEQVEISIPKPKLDEPVQVKACRGDVIFVLHKVGHRGGPNYSPDVRRMVYFRVSHRDHNKNKMASLNNLWLDYEGMSDVL